MGEHFMPPIKRAREKYGKGPTKRKRGSGVSEDELALGIATHPRGVRQDGGGGGGVGGGGKCGALWGGRAIEGGYGREKRVENLRRRTASKPGNLNRCYLPHHRTLDASYGGGGCVGVWGWGGRPDTGKVKDCQLEQREETVNCGRGGCFSSSFSLIKIKVFGLKGGKGNVNGQQKGSFVPRLVPNKAFPDKKKGISAVKR